VGELTHVKPSYEYAIDVCAVLLLPAATIKLSVIRGDVLEPPPPAIGGRADHTLTPSPIFITFVSVE
jgi:hypothetical protein